MNVVAGVDIGGSHVGIGLVSTKSDELASKSVHLLAADYDFTSVDVLVNEITTNIKLMVDKMGCKLIGVGIGIPGQTKDGIFIGASNVLVGQTNLPICAMVTKILGVPSIIMNDADAILSGEVYNSKFLQKFGENTSTVMITLGTGVGVSLYLNGKIYESASGTLEGGHMIVCNENGLLCGCGQRGCLEKYASASSVVKHFNEAEIKLPHAANAAVSASGAKDVFKYFEDGNSNAIRIINEACDYLALLCLNICRVLDVEVIIFGGGMSKSGDMLLNLINKYIKERTWTILPTDVKLMISTVHQEEAGIVGTALAIKNHLKCGSEENFAMSMDSLVQPSHSNSVVIEQSTYKDMIWQCVLPSLLLGGVIGFTFSKWLSRK